MYYIINISDTRFSLDGIQYLKNYVSTVYGTRLEIFNCYERSDVLVEQANYDQFSVDGIVYTTAAQLQSALASVIYSRTTLGGGVTFDQDNIDIVKTVAFALADNDAAILAKINALPAYTIGEKQSVWFDSAVLKYKMLNYGKGTYGVGGTQLTLADIILIYKDVQGQITDVEADIATLQDAQDNIDIIKPVGKLYPGFTIADVLEKINEVGAYTITDVQSIWFRAQVYDVIGTDPFGEPISGVVRTLVYKMMRKGKGAYGVGGIELVAADILQVVDTPVVASDIPATQTINFGALTTQTVSEWLNAKNPAIVVQAVTDGYVLFKGTINGDAASYLFVGTAGTYGVGQSQSTMSDFQLLDNAATPPVVIPTAQQVLGAGNTVNDTPLFLVKGTEKIKHSGLGTDYKNDVNGKQVNIRYEVPPAGVPNVVTLTVPAKAADDTFAMKSDLLPAVLNVTDIENLELISVDVGWYTSSDGRRLHYLTDIYRTFDLTPWVPDMTNGNDIHKVGNDLIIIANSTGSTTEATPIKLIVLKDCRLVDKILVLGSVTVCNDLIVKSRTHGSDFHNGYLYISTRPPNATIPTQVMRINPYDFSDRKYYEFPTSFAARPTDIISYKDGIYALMCNFTTNSSVLTHKFVKLDENLNSYTVVFEFPGNAQSNLQKVYSAYPFVIYNDEIYFLANNGGDFGTVSMYVYNFKGEIVRSNNSININPSSATLTVNYVPHWISVFGGKLIITPTGTSSQQWKVLRIDTSTLLLEDLKVLPVNPTDDNTITKDGTIYMNGEGEPSVSYLMKMKYNDFSTYSVELSNYCSTGSLNSAHFIQKEAKRTKWSDFINDVLPNVNNTSDIAKPVSTAQAAAIALKLNLSGGALTGPLTTLGVVPTTNLGSDLGGAALLYNNAFVGTIRSSVYRAISSSNGILFSSTGNTTLLKIFDATGNLIVQTGGTPADDGINKLQVTGGIKLTGLLGLGQFTTGTEPAWVKGSQYFNTTLNKARVGGATAWETITSV